MGFNEFGGKVPDPTRWNARLQTDVKVRDALIRGDQVSASAWYPRCEFNDDVNQHQTWMHHLYLVALFFSHEPRAYSGCLLTLLGKTDELLRKA